MTLALPHLSTSTLMRPLTMRTLPAVAVHMHLPLQVTCPRSRQNHNYEGNSRVGPAILHSDILARLSRLCLEGVKIEKIPRFRALQGRSKESGLGKACGRLPRTGGTELVEV